MIVMRDPKTFYFDFDWPKDADENLKHETEFIIKSNESLAERNKKGDWTTIVQIQAWNQYSWTRKTPKRMNHINLFLSCNKD